MNGEHSTADSSDELSGILGAAVEQVMREPIPDAAMERALDRTSQRLIPSARSPRRLRSSAVLGLAAVLAACIVLVVWYSRPADLWAQVVKAVQAKPWIHGVVRFKGKSLAEFWEATRGTTVAWRSMDRTDFVDEQSKILFHYDANAKVLCRNSASGTHWVDNDTGISLECVEGILRGDKKLKSPWPDFVVKDQHHRQIKKDGRDWDEWELVLQDPTESAQGTFKILVDPQTHLPHSMTGQSMGVVGIINEYDYPESGPADVYALGVAKNVTMVDCIPTGETARAIATIKAYHDEFDDFHAVVFRDTPVVVNVAFKRPSAILVWKKGAQWRVEESELRFTDDVVAEADFAKDGWLRKACAMAKFSPRSVCDGKFVYGDDFKRIHGWSLEVEHAMPQWLAYPSQSLVPEGREFHFDKDPLNRVAGSALLQVRMIGAPPSALNAFERYWLDPKRNFAVVQHEMFQTDPAKTPLPQQIWRASIDSWKQTPKGIWYPTHVVGSFFAKNWKRTDRYFFILQFGSEMPDSLFKPEQRTVFLDRYPVK